MAFTCDPGFNLQGQAAIQCLANGSWSSHLPVCKPVQCSMLHSIAYGLKNSSNNTYTSTVKFSCADGFVLDGAALLACQSDGRWSASLPRCSPVQCPPLSPEPYSKVLKQNSSFSGESVSFCLSGYMQAGGNARRVCDKNKQWDGQPIYCRGKLNLFSVFSYFDFHIKHGDVMMLSKLSL